MTHTVNQEITQKYKRNFKLFKKLFFVLAVAPIILAGLVFTFLQKSYSPPPYTGTLPCVSYSPDDFSRDRNFSEEELMEVLVKIKKVSNCVRIYSVTRGIEKVPELAKRMEMEVIAGAWLVKSEPKINAEELKNLIEIGREYDNIKYLIVGNETALLNNLSEEELIRSINIVRAGVYGSRNKNVIAKLAKEKKYPPITTTEIASVWVNKKSVINEIDVVGLHSFSYWEWAHIDDALPTILNTFERVRNVTDKPIVFLETGWPTAGPPQGLAESGLLSQRKFLKMMDENFGAQGIFYNIAEMFDVPAKVANEEGLLGPHWGIFDKNGNQKTLLTVKDISLWFAIYILLMVIMLWYFLGYFEYPFIKNDPRYERRNDSGLDSSLLASFFIIIILACVFSTVTMLYSKLMGVNIIMVQILCGLISLYGFFEISQKIMQNFISKHAAKYLLSRYSQVSVEEKSANTDVLVSIHIAAKDEDPEQVIRTLTSALAQTHKKIEVVYVDNNSKDENGFNIVKKHFDSLSVTEKFGEDKVLSLHFEKNIFGFKGGALNYAIHKSNPDAQYIAILDSDYEAYPNWIETGLIYAKDDVGFIQFPQSYRGGEDDAQGAVNSEGRNTENFISRGARLEQDYVFKVMYPMRAILGNIVMNGTMVIIRKAALPEHNWPLWSICEDGALGAEIIAKGYRSAFVPTVAGQGGSPETFSELSKQRNRWVFGSIQILKMWMKDKKLKWNRTMSMYLSDWFGWIMHGLYPFIIIFTISFILSVWFVYFSIIYDWTFFLGLTFIGLSLILFIINIAKYIGCALPKVTKANTTLKFGDKFKLCIKNIFSLILLELSVVNIVCVSVLQSVYKNKMNFNATRSPEYHSHMLRYGASGYKKFIGAVTNLLLIALPAILVLFALCGSYFILEKTSSNLVYVVYGQFVVVFLPQLIYLIYKLKYK